jgi:hypothetical protein
MKNILISVLIIIGLVTFSCTKKDVESKNFTLLTSHNWVSDSLLIDGNDASGPGGMLEIFKGDVIFNKDRTGTYGKYTGTWSFAEEETKIVLTSDSLGFPLTTNIEELTNISLKITTVFPRAGEPENPMDIRMTFNAK